jgi:glyoxylase-like metal-dependent hydrolase (beta-lactamase superfamily II)
MVTNGIHATNPCFLVRHPKGDLLWDLGMPSSIADASDGITMGRVRIRVDRKLVDLLAQLGLAPADIDYVSISHSHFDHVGNAELFPNATWIVDADERAWALRSEARTNASAPLYRALGNASTRVIQGSEDFDVFDDGTVIIVQAPGHTPGHTALLLRLPHAGAVMLAGDIWNTVDSWTARRGSSQELATMAKIDRLIAENSARLIRQHIAEDFESLPRFPHYLH